MTTTHLRFDNEEVNEIQDLLESCGNDETMDIGVIDGFFTALSVLKNPRPDDVVIPYLFSVTGDAAAVPKNERLFELLTLRRNVVNAALRAGNGLDPIILPILDDDENPIEGPDGIEAVSPWCAGFFMGLFQGASEKLALSDAAHAALAVIASYIPDDTFEFSDEEKTARELWDAVSGEEAVKVSLADALYRIVEAAYRLKAEWNPNAPVRNTAARVGRNDPCPCGSGKKYKQCCGKK